MLHDGYRRCSHTPQTVDSDLPRKALRLLSDPLQGLCHLNGGHGAWLLRYHVGHLLQNCPILRQLTGVLRTFPMRLEPTRVRWKNDQVCLTSLKTSGATVQWKVNVSGG